MALDSDTLSPLEHIVSALYKGILNREPDENGRDYHVQLMRQGISLDKIVHAFIDCAEFQLNSQKNVVSLGALDALPANPIQFDLSAEQRKAVWRRVAEHWSRLGETQPFFSVLTAEEFRAENISPDAIDRFYATGQAEVERAAKYFARNHCTLPVDGVCVDYGCGLGRTTLWLARHFRRVVAVDVSETHLAAARRALGERGVRNVEFCLVRGPDDLSLLRSFDFFYSVLALQHSPPPVILEILQTVFAGLNIGGGAFFQVPTYGRDYRWLYHEYVNDVSSEDELGMHAVPQSMIFAAAADAGCQPLEVQPDWYTGIPHWISNTFVLVKPRRAAITALARQLAALHQSFRRRHWTNSAAGKGRRAKRASGDST